jgi:hypothetical protein
MSEMTRGQLWAEFFAVAETAIPNEEPTIQAQYLFKKLMGLSDPEARNLHLSRPEAQTSFLEAASQMLGFRTGKQLQTTASYETIKGMLPEKDQNPRKGVGQVLNKLELQFGVRAPVANCK